MRKHKQRAIAATQWAVDEVDQLFIRVARYTRFVLFSKWFLGVFAILLLAGLIFWPLFGKDKTGLRVSFTSTQGKSGIDAPVMSNPRFVGDNAKNERFVVTGSRAIQQTAQVVVIEEVEAQLIKPDNHILGARAKTAVYHQDTKMLEMSGEVTMFDDQGMIFVTDAAVMNVATLDVDGASPIEGVNASGKLVANGFQIRDKGREIKFGTAKERVKLTIEQMKKKK